MSATLRNYEDSSRKIQELFENSRSMLASYGFNNSPVIAEPTYPIQQVSPLPSNSEDLFTPPELLAECKKFMLNSSRKSEERRDSFDLPGSDFLAQSTQKKMTFSGLLGNTTFEPQRHSPMGEGKIAQLVASEACSEGVSMNASNAKPSSEVHFQVRVPTIHSVEGLLLDIFKSGCKTALTVGQINELKGQLADEVKNVFEEYCDLLLRQFGP